MPVQPKMTFAQIAKDLKTYLVITIVGLLWYVLESRIDKSDTDDLRYEKALQAKDIIIAQKDLQIKEMNKENQDFLKLIWVQKGAVSGLTKTVDSLNNKNIHDEKNK